MRSIHLLVAGLAVPLWGACAPDRPSPEEVKRRAQRYDRELDCTDTGGLFEAQIQIRVQNEYVNHSTEETERCFNCLNFEPAMDETTCGSCTTVPGPINPLGHCTAWVYKTGA